MFLAQDVQLYSIMFPHEQAYEIISKMGWLENVHLLDTQSETPSIQRPYYAQLRRCELLSGRLDDIEMLLRQLKFPISYCPNIDGYLARMKLNEAITSPQATFDTYESEVMRRFAFLEQQQNNLFKIIEKRNTLYEQKALMLQGREIIFKDYKFSSRMTNIQQGSALRKDNDQDQRTFSKNKLQELDYKLNCLAGSVSTQDIEKFHRLLFRASKGNIWFDVKAIQTHDIILRENPDSHVPDGLIDAKTYQKQDKSTFILFFQPGLYESMRKKLIKLCEAFNVVFYVLPDDGQQYELAYGRLQLQLHELESLLLLTSTELKQYALYFTGMHTKEMQYEQIYAEGYASYIEEVRLFIQLQKGIYFHLNYFSVQATMMVGKFWCPQKFVEAFTTNLREVSQLFQIFPLLNQVEYEPPTYLKVNDFTWAFQELVNTYGIPRFGEINPAMFAIITFPFLFAIMFGDIGHGVYTHTIIIYQILLTTFGLYLLLFGESMVINNAKEYRADPVDTRDIKYLYKARYMLLMMGLFSTYCGFIYNDFFSIPLNYSNSCYEGGLRVLFDCSPQFGLDGAWGTATNELSMTNSMKMKLAIIVGVTHMLFGILMKGINSINNRSGLDLLCEFVPQMLFMMSTFGYMSALIIVKWFTVFEDTSQAPSIITTQLNMYFKMGGVVGYQFYPNQPQIQFYLIMVTLVCVPWMLLLKPIFKIMQRTTTRSGDHVEFQDEPNQVELQVQDIIPTTTTNLAGCLVESREMKEERHFQVDEIVIEQVIETIEFVLGSVSNTASYLRLWALSLAHNQLSQVFFQKTLGSALLTGSIPMIIGTFFIFFGITVMVLMCMDALECFLHALRLHWVEFQNKFYKADGYSFQCFSLRLILEEDKDYNTRI